MTSRCCRSASCSEGCWRGHGAQKLFERFNGPGREGHQRVHGDARPQARAPWVYLAGGSEFGGGVLTASGCHTRGPSPVIGSMAMARPRPIAASPSGSPRAVLSLPSPASPAIATRWSRQVVARPCSGHPAAGLNRILGLAIVILTLIYADRASDMPQDQDEAREALAGEEE